jgi:glycosyltransferase involved in cell wall biosynthesis
MKMLKYRKNIINNTLSKGINNMQNLVFITRNLKAGGAERVIAQLANHFVNKDINCKIITLDNEEVFYELNKKIELYSIGRKSNNSYIDKFQRYRELRRYLKINKPDIILTLPEEIGIYVIPSLIGTKIPVVVSERNNPWVMPWKKETRLLRKLFYPFAAGFIFQTNQAASFFPESIRKKGIVLPNPLDLKRIPQSWVGEKQKEILGAGRLETQKNFPLLIKAFAKFYKLNTDYSLTIYGEGSQREDLEDLASSLLPKSAYSFPGKTTELVEKMKYAQIFVLSSDFEGMPNVLIEAMAMGMPVISTDCPSGGAADLINNGYNGLLVPVGDEEAMFNSMREIAENESLRSTIGFNASEIKKLLDSEKVADQWRIYLEKCSKRKKKI